MISGLSQYILAGFMAPVNLGTTVGTLLLALPLIAVIATVYKTTKLEDIRLIHFVREILLLFGSILVFSVITAVVIFGIIKLAIG